MPWRKEVQEYAENMEGSEILPFAEGKFENHVTHKMYRTVHT
jgi:hypothetical protein